MKVTEIEKLVKETKKNKRNWFQRLAETLKDKGVKFTESEICSNGYHSGDVKENSKEIKIFSWGRGIKARSGFNYNIYPVIIIQK